MFEHVLVLAVFVSTSSSRCCILFKYWNLIFQKHNKNRLHVVLSHIRCLKKEGIFFSNHHASLSIFLHLYTTQLKHTYLLNTKQLSTLLSNFITVDLLLLCHEKWIKSLCPRVCSNPIIVICSVTLTVTEFSHTVGLGFERGLK